MTQKKALPLTLSKKQLCIALGLYSRQSNRVYYDKLRKHYLTNTVLQELNISPDTFDRRGAYTFDAISTKRLFALIEELKELKFE